MFASLVADVAARPAVFAFRGPVEREEIERWLNKRDYVVPGELVELWQETGGGDVFESEELLVPVLQEALPDATVDERTKHWIERGLQPWVVLFHEGFLLSGVDQRNGELVSLDRSRLLEYGRFSTLEEWYQGTIRAEFAERYGLT